MNCPQLFIVPASSGIKVHTENSSRALARIVQSVTKKFQEIVYHAVISGIPSHGGSLLEPGKRLHQEIARECVDPVVMGFIAQAHVSAEVQSQAEEIIENTLHMRLQNANETVNITLLGGSKLTLCTPYYLTRPPKGRGRPRKQGKRGKSPDCVWEGFLL